MSKIFHKLIKQICAQNGINYKFLSKDWIIMLEKNNKTKFITGYKFDLNKHGLGMILDDKYATFEMLESKNIPVIKHNIVYSSSNKNDYALDCNSIEYLNNLFYKYNNDIVLKINNGTCGVNVYHITNENELVKYFNKISNESKSFSICPYYDILNEYRIIVLNGEIQLMYKKIKPVVYGDSKSTIKELLIEFNNKYFKEYNELNKDVILEKGEKFEYSWQFNLSRGAISSLGILEKDKLELLKIVKEINSYFKIGFGSIDIIKTVNNQFFVMEINSGVMMDNYIIQNENGHATAKNIYEKAILQMFM